MSHALCIGGGYPLPIVTDRGVSEAAQSVRILLTEATSVSDSISLGGVKTQAYEALAAAFAEASEDDWDGNDSAAADPSSYEYARSFIAMLPNTIPAPEADVDPDGELSLEWCEGPRKVFSISVARDGTLTYAGLFGVRVSHGSEPFSDDLPEIVVSHLDRFSS